MKATLLSLLLFYSCTQHADLDQKGVTFQISPIQMEVSHLNDIDWKVGLKKEYVVGQSITFIIDLPKMKERDLEVLTKHKGIDSWILRLIVTRGSESQDLGSLYAMFKPKRFSRTTSGNKATSSVSLKIYYAAAFASEKFRSFSCPAFSHNKKIKEMSIEGQNEEFSLSLGQSLPYNEKSHLVELTPSAFNGGNSLLGNYHIEIAAYDSINKTIHSSFKRIPMYVSVQSEESINTDSCSGIHPERE